MSVPRIFERGNASYFFIASCYFIACFTLYLLGALYIQFMMLLATIAILPALVVREKNNRNKPVNESNLSVDEQWSKRKKELDKICDDLAKAKDAGQRQKLQRSRLSLESELRRIEWKVRESDLTQMYNASKGKLRELPDLKESSPEIGEDGVAKTKEYRKTLSKIMKDANSILKHEPLASRSQALAPIVSLLCACYNNLKRSTDKSLQTVAVDYFVAWATFSSIAKDIDVDPNLAKYASPEYRKNFKKVLQKMNPPRPTFESTEHSRVVTE